MNQEAKKEGNSLSKFARQHYLGKPGEDEVALAALTEEVKRATHKAQKSLEQGLTDAESILTKLRSTPR